MKINLHIERLVLHGGPLEPAAQAQLQLALETELVSLLQTEAWPSDYSSGVNLDTLNSTMSQPAEGHTPVQLGQAIAGAVHSSMGKQN